MHKLIILSGLLAMALAAPKPSGVVYSSPILTPVAPQIVTSVVSPGSTSISSYSNSVVHGTPVVTVPVVRHVSVSHVVPIVQETSYVHALPYVYPEHVVVA